MLNWAKPALVVAALAAVPVLGQVDVPRQPAPEDTSAAPSLSQEEWLASEWANDLNLDGAVDAADYGMWAAVGTDGPILIAPGPVDTGAAPTLSLDEWLVCEWAADLNLDAAVDAADYEMWVAAGGNGPVVIAPNPTAVETTSWAAIKGSLTR